MLYIKVVLDLIPAWGLVFVSNPNHHKLFFYMTTFIECSLLRGKDWFGQFKEQSLYLELKQGQWQTVTTKHTCMADP